MNQADGHPFGGVAMRTIMLLSILIVWLNQAPVQAQHRPILGGRRPLLPRQPPSQGCPAVEIVAGEQAKPEMWGSLSGKLINEKTEKPLADAIVFLKASEAGFPIHADDKKPPQDLVIRLPAGMLFDFRMMGHYVPPSDDKLKPSAGRKLTIVGDAVQDHIVRIDLVAAFDTDGKTEQMAQKRVRSGDPDPTARGGRAYIAAGTEASFVMKLNAAYLVRSETYPELAARVVVFDHPYFAFTQKDGSFTMPRVPVGEWALWAWQEDVGFAMGKAGRKITLKAGKNTYERENR
jgi:hypothetical protein